MLTNSKTRYLSLYLLQLLYIASMDRMMNWRMNNRACERAVVLRRTGSVPAPPHTLSKSPAARHDSALCIKALVIKL